MQPHMWTSYSMRPVHNNRQTGVHKWPSHLSRSRNTEITQLWTHKIILFDNYFRLGIFNDMWTNENVFSCHPKGAHSPIHTHTLTQTRRHTRQARGSHHSPVAPPHTVFAPRTHTCSTHDRPGPRGVGGVGGLLRNILLVYGDKTWKSFAICNLTINIYIFFFIFEIYFHI